DWPEPCAGPRLLDLGMTLEAAANGQGVALARPSLARAWLAEGRLVVLFPLRSAPTHHYHLRSHQASPASQRFAAWLAAICREAVAQGREFLPAADD
ncbi:TPA: LysR family transcriptional regulator, partial [Pseudomonas aeruginosa]